MLKRIRDFILINIAIVILTLVADRIVLLTRLDHYLRENPEPYVSITVIMTAVGFTLFMGMLIYSLIRSGGPTGNTGALARAR